ncbi:MAG: T9SS type A sorting domain-containing protein, partial [Chitinivibrionales bacterium]|nr:T9SS type A sorting domain-containing protein [Chitinivibrionales bacterium]
QGMCFQWYGMYKFFRDRPKPNVLPGPYTCGISESFYPTGYKDTNHPTEDGPVAKIIALGWYLTLAGEDALDEVIKPYLDNINSFNKGTFPGKDFIPTSVWFTKKAPSAVPVSIKSRAITIRSKHGYTIHVTTLQGKLVYQAHAEGAGDYLIPVTQPGVYTVTIMGDGIRHTGKAVFFTD